VSRAPQQPVREALTEAALELFYRQGVASTTLVDIAGAAGVPTGNVYYHFRTKEALVEAVIDKRTQELKRSLAEADVHGEPLARLKAIIRSYRSRVETEAETVIAYGCPYASLLDDLSKLDSKHLRKARGLLKLYVDYARRQFEALGKGDETEDLALEFISRIQGAYVLGRGFASSDMLVRQLERLEAWLEAQV
jgi:TetR/AcrR family transcriptional regulator, transcriptional repressor for nem operon